MNKRLKKLIAPVLLAALLLTAVGCGGQPENVQEPQTTAADPIPTAGDDAAVSTGFAMLYDKDSSLNPYSGENGDNYLVSQLLYEKLFVLDDRFEPKPQLCAEYATQDGLTYTFKLLEGVKFSDGTDLKAIDAVYSLVVAKDVGRYARRLSVIDSCSQVDDYTFTVTLTKANYLLPSLLDVPIVAYDTGYSDIPVGSGPYKLTGSQLVASPYYRGQAPQKTITLTDLTTSYAEAFSMGKLDLVCDDVCGSDDIVFSGNYEMHYYNTTVMDYIGFNMSNYFLSDGAIREGIAALIDRQSIVDQIYMTRATASPVVISPASWLYDVTWDVAEPVGPEKLSQAMGKMGLRDANHDGVVELPSGDTPFSLDFIVNAENPYKVRAAQYIMTDLQRLGVGVRLRELPWDDFCKALQEGDFDLYYAEVYLPADFDCSVLLDESGAHNYGGIYNPEYGELLDAYRAAPDRLTRSEAAKAMCDKIRQNNPIVPVLFRKHAAVLRRNKASGTSPTQSSVFYDFDNWQIK